MLQNASLLAIVAVDTEENEPSKVRQLDNWVRLNIGRASRQVSWPRRTWTALQDCSATAASALVEKFDTELFSDFSAKSSNFRRLVLSCINADFCVQILILQRFSRSTRFSHLCTARNSTSSQKFVKLFHVFAEIYVKISIFQQFSSNFAQISMRISQNFDE